MDTLGLYAELLSVWLYPTLCASDETDVIHSHQACTNFFCRNIVTLLSKKAADIEATRQRCALPQWQGRYVWMTLHMEAFSTPDYWCLASSIILTACIVSMAWKSILSPCKTSQSWGQAMLCYIGRQWIMPSLWDLKAIMKIQWSDLRSTHYGGCFALAWPANECVTCFSSGHISMPRTLILGL